MVEQWRSIVDGIATIMSKWDVDLWVTKLHSNLSDELDACHVWDSTL